MGLISDLIREIPISVNLKAKLDIALKDIVVLTENNALLTKENEMLKAENNDLREKINDLERGYEPDYNSCECGPLDPEAGY